jgi:hypothetical protein
VSCQQSPKFDRSGSREFLTWCNREILTWRKAVATPQLKTPILITPPVDTSRVGLHCERIG